MTDSTGSRTLGDILRTDARMPVDRSLPLVRAAAGALDAFHAREGLHGALESEAFVVDSDGGVTLRHPSEREVIAGSADVRPYLSPQRRAGEPPRPADDLYALGVVAYRLLLGRLPTSAVSGQRVVRDDVPPDVERVLLTQLATAPSRRFASGAELIQELEQAFAAGRAVAGDGDGLFAEGASRGPGLAVRPTTESGAWWHPVGAGRMRAAPITSLALSELPDGPGPAARSAGRRVTRRNDYPEIGLPGLWVVVIATILCSVYLLPLYFMLFRAS